MTASLALAIPLGIAFGMGAWTLVALIPRVGAPRLATRVAPYLIDLSAEARATVDRRPSEPGSMLAGLAAPAAAQAARLLATVLGGDEGISRRMRQAGRADDVQGFRSRQLMSAIVGLGAGVAAAVLAAHATTASGLLLAAIVVLCAAAGLVAPEQLLARAARSRQSRIANELPTVLEFLTLSLSAGESILDALRRIARTGTGELAREFGRVVADVNTGMALPVALTRCSSMVALPALTRMIDQLVGALERGTPLIEVLRAQAQDSREDAKRQLLEAAGRKEVAMLVPLVFLILPVTIAFAIFPGILVLSTCQYSSMTFVPFDADEDEIAELSVLRSGVPTGMRSALWGWITTQLDEGHGYASVSRMHDLESALQVSLGAPSSGLMQMSTAIQMIGTLEEKQQIRIVDRLLAVRGSDATAAALNHLLELNRSAVVAVPVEKKYRLTHRVPEGVADAVRSAISLDAQAGALLASAWTFAYGVDPQPTQAMDSAVRAVETLAIATMVPIRKRPNATLGDAIGTMKADGDWTHGLRELGGKAPANETIYDMLQTLWAGQQYRHVHPDAAPPTIEQARTHVQLAAALVAWLASGQVVRTTAAPPASA